jgi:hypothetical protein
MKRLKYFFDCYFNQTFGFDQLDEQIMKFRNRESEKLVIQLITEFHQIINKRNYKNISVFIDKYCDFSINSNETEKFINYLYDKFVDRPTIAKATDFIKQYKVVFCPICVKDSKLTDLPKIIYRATLVGKNIEIYLCKLCRSAWLDENDIRIDNGQNYKALMKANGLKGWWKELKDVDFL